MGRVGLNEKTFISGINSICGLQEKVVKVKEIISIQLRNQFIFLSEICNFIEEMDLLPELFILFLIFASFMKISVVSSF